MLASLILSDCPSQDNVTTHGNLGKNPDTTKRRFHLSYLNPAELPLGTLGKSNFSTVFNCCRVEK